MNKLTLPFKSYINKHPTIAGAYCVKCVDKITNQRIDVEKENKNINNEILLPNKLINNKDEIDLSKTQYNIHAYLYSVAHYYKLPISDKPYSILLSLVSRRLIIFVKKIFYMTNEKARLASFIRRYGLAEMISSLNIKYSDNNDIDKLRYIWNNREPLYLAREAKNNIYQYLSDKLDYHHNDVSATRAVVKIIGMSNISTYPKDYILNITRKYKTKLSSTRIINSFTICNLLNINFKIFSKKSIKIALKFIDKNFNYLFLSWDGEKKYMTLKNKSLLSLQRQLKKIEKTEPRIYKKIIYPIYLQYILQ